MTLSENTIAEKLIWRSLGGAPVINLRQRPEKWERIARSLEGVIPGEKLHRIEAVAGVELPDFGAAPWFRGRGGDRRWAARAGCALSHRKALELAARSGWEHTLVLEDDADLSGASAGDLHEVLAWLFEHRDRWDVCYLGFSKASPPSARVATVGDFSILRTKGCATTHAYLVNRRVRDWLLQQLPDERNIWEWISRHRAIDRWYVRNLYRSFTVLAVSPALFLQAEGFSDILGKDVNYNGEFAGRADAPATTEAAFSRKLLLAAAKDSLSSVHDGLRALRTRLRGF